MTSLGRWFLCALAALAVSVAARGARADDAPFSPPPPPELAPDWWELELGASALVPLERSAMCPGVSTLGRAASCVINAGVGLGMRLTYRSPDGMGWLVAYDLWVLDSANVYEVALAHTVRGGFRYVLDASSRFQPWVGATVGVMLFGEPAAVATAGGVVTAGGGVHAELDDDFAVFASANAWVFATAPFQTSDGARRSDPFGVNVSLEIMLGAVIRIGSLVRP